MLCSFSGTQDLSSWRYRATAYYFFHAEHSHQTDLAANTSPNGQEANSHIIMTIVRTKKDITIIWTIISQKNDE